MFGQIGRTFGSLFGGARQAAGNLVAAAGGALGIPETGLSERIAGRPTPRGEAVGKAQAQYNPFGRVSPQQAAQQRAFQNLPPSQKGGGSSGGGAAGGGVSGGGGQPTPTGDQGYQGFQEQPSEVDTSYIDELLNPALSALEGLESETRSLLGGGEQQAEAYRSAAEAKATGAKQTGLGQVQTQEAGAKTAAEEAEFQQRRGFGEISQQFGGRFGRSGFGQGVLGSIAENTLQTVGRIRTGLQGVVQELNTRRNQLEDIFNSAVQEASSEVENLKQNARGKLQNALAQIGQSRVALQTRKSELVNSALENYRQTIAQVNARNTEFQQQLSLQKQQSDLRIQEAQARANNSLQNLPSFSLQP